MNRAKNLEQIRQTQEWDIAIVGGGASGLGIAVDAANRGFKTVLFEKISALAAIVSSDNVSNRKVSI